MNSNMKYNNYLFINNQNVSVPVSVPKTNFSSYPITNQSISNSYVLSYGYSNNYNNYDMKKIDLDVNNSSYNNTINNKSFLNYNNSLKLPLN